MKINWGQGIAIFYAVFVLALVTQLVISFQYDRSLVVEDYYAEDLAYQKHYNKLVNTVLPGESAQISHNGNAITVRFPAAHQGVSGDILLYRPNDKSLDKHLIIKADSTNQMHIPATELTRGYWRIKVNWQSQNKSYFSEDLLRL